MPSGRNPLHALRGSGDYYPLAWIGVLVVSAVLLQLLPTWTWLTDLPPEWQLPIAAIVKAAMQWFVDNFQWFFRFLSGLLEWPMYGIRDALHWLPWSTTIALICLIAWQGGGWRTAALAFIALMYIVVVGYWEEGLNTLALVIVCIPLAVLFGFSLGVWGYRSRSANNVIQVVLDLMQTVPAFAYLIPILLLFGFGPVVGLTASMIFAIPPMVRNTILGLQRIPPGVRESAVMSGCTRRQTFWWVEVPTSLPQLLVGINQTTMCALAMVIIAAIIGGFEDIGWEVLSRMRKAQFGQSILSGFVIVALAILLDRITSAYAKRQLPTASHCGLGVREFCIAALILLAATAAIAFMLEPMRNWPKDWVFYPAEQMNDAVDYVIITFGSFLDSVKNSFLFFVLLPVKLGLKKAVAPFTWGFSMTPLIAGLYWAAAILAAAGLLFVSRWRLAVTTMLVSAVLYYGVTGLAWPATIAVLTLFAYQLGGLRVAAFVFGTLLFLLLSGIWSPAMTSIYLCSIAVAVCILVGGLIGLWAANSNTVSSVVRPINDTLQTLPQFVLLIPALMLFQVGDFPALMAICAYAIVPMIRYTEHGLRHVPVSAIEAGICSGCTPFQLFWQIRLKLALPQILLGVNQTILFGLAMLVIAALVGTTGLGQQIYIALGKADAGWGIVAGLGMALIAMSADRMMQSYIRRRQQSLQFN